MGPKDIKRRFKHFSAQGDMNARSEIQLASASDSE
jgi:hypothetical protein